jgi:hypothetical protein
MAMSLLEMKAQIQDPMRQGIVDMLWQSSRVMQLLNFIPYNGLSYPYAQRTKLAGVDFRSLNTSFARTMGVTNPAVESLSILGGAARTDTIISTQKPNTRQNEIAGMMEASGKFFDKNFFNGNPGTNPKAFYGLKARLANNQLLTNATNGSPVSYKNVITLQDAVNSDNSEKVLLMNRTNRRLLTADVETHALGLQKVVVGQQLTEFNGSKIVEVFKDETETDILQFNETCGGSNACSSIYCVKFGGQVDERDVQGIMGLPQFVTHTGPFEYGEYLEDVIQSVAGIGIFGGYSAARLQGCTAA